MKAALFDEIKNISLIDTDLPEITENEILIETLLTGICGSEVHALLGKHPFRKPPSVLGHEVIGKITEIGSRVFGFEVGDRVTVEPQIVCNSCQSCKQGMYNLCDKKVVLGTKKWQGSFAEYLVAPADTVHKIPHEISNDEAILVEPLAVGVHAMDIARVKKGDKVAILGAGPIGLLAAVSAHNAGAQTLLLTDAIEKNLKVGEKLGATDVVNILEKSTQEYINDMDKFDHVFITVGVKSIIGDALNIIKKRGNIIIIALFEDKVPVNLNQVMLQEVHLLGSSMYVRKDFNKAIEIIASKKYPLEDLITHRVKLSEINQALNIAHTKEGFPIKIVVEVGDKN